MDYFPIPACPKVLYLLLSFYHLDEIILYRIGSLSKTGLLRFCSKGFSIPLIPCQIVAVLTACC